MLKLLFDRLFRRTVPVKVAIHRDDGSVKELTVDMDRNAAKALRTYAKKKPLDGDNVIHEFH